MEKIVKEAADFVTKLLTDKLPPAVTYHNLNHAREVYEGVTELGSNSSLSDEELEIIQIAAWFHDTGFIKGYVDHEYKSIEIAKEYLNNIRYPERKIGRIIDIIYMTELGNVPTNLSEKIIRDADVLHIGKDDFYVKSLNLKTEWESFEIKNYTEVEWLQSSLDFILRTDFFTDYARSKYESGRQENIVRLNAMINNHNDLLLEPT
jgi:predicted metal-dependent HD superfamily phosphohydrolase